MALAGVVTLGACAVALPSAPSVLAVPGQGKTLEAFQQDDVTCRQYASEHVSYAQAQASSQGATGNVIAGTGIGAAIGALLGAATGDAGTGAALGAGSGLLVGGSSGSSVAQASSAGLQRQYDMAYLQCMVTKGDTVPSLAAPPYVPAPYAYPRYPYPPY
ncbi:MAG TPA: glycine zipper family protein [Stellaceae bacterium]